MGAPGHIKPDIDRSVPALLVRVGDYAIHHGGLGAIRSLGRLGVPVYAYSRHQFTPALRSRHLAGRFDWAADESADPGEIAGQLAEVASRIGRPAIAIAGDDEAAVLLAEQAGALSDVLILPDIAPDLPRRLCSKRGLSEVCQKVGIPTARVAFPTTVDELAQTAREFTFPVVVKKMDSWARLRLPDLPTTAIITNEADLLHRYGPHVTADSVLVQEYLPGQPGDDWFAHFYADATSDAQICLTGRKLRSWPPGAGWTAYARGEANPVLIELTRRLCETVGYHGIGDLDIRFDRRDGQFKLLDFNPRIGAQFRSAQTDTGIDTVRALHLDLTGRAVPVGRQLSVRFVAENIDLAARLAYRRLGIALPADPADPAKPERTERGWWAVDDPIPYALMLVRGLFNRLSAPLRALRARRERRTTGEG